MTTGKLVMTHKKGPILHFSQVLHTPKWGFVAVAGPLVAISRDGKKWSEHEPSAEIASIALAGNALFGTGYSSTELFSSEDGKKWSSCGNVPKSEGQAGPVGADEKAALVSSSNGDPDRIYRWASGKFREVAELPKNASLRKIWTGPGGLRVAVGYGATIAVSRDGGDEWKVQSIAATQELRDVAGTEVALFAVGRDGIALRSDDAGKTWTPIHVGITGRDRSINAVWVSADGKRIAMGANRGQMVISENGGAKWSKVKSGSTEDIMSIAGDETGKLVAVGFARTIAAFDSA